jgi:hypothetical protein
MRTHVDVYGLDNRQKRVPRCEFHWGFLVNMDACGLIFKTIIGAGEMNRTPDLLITNELLYRLSYTGFSIEL